MTMQFDSSITDALKAFVEAPEDERDYAKAADAILRISGNLVRHKMWLREGLQNHADSITKIASGLYEFRAAKMTSQQVSVMKVQAAVAVDSANQDEPKYAAGKRPDHDSLPDEVKGWYVEALDVLHRIQDTHLQMRRLALSQTSCPESELYPFVKDIIRLDNRRLKLWEMYDNFKAE